MNNLPLISFRDGLMVKNLLISAGDMSCILGSERSPGGGNGNPLLDSCLGNAMDRGTWWASLWGCKSVRHDLVTKQQQEQPKYPPTGKQMGYIHIMEYYFAIK